MMWRGSVTGCVHVIRSCVPVRGLHLHIYKRFVLASFHSVLSGFIFRFAGTMVKHMGTSVKQNATVLRSAAMANALNVRGNASFTNVAT